MLDRTTTPPVRGGLLHRCRTCGFRSRLSASFRVEAGGLLGRRETVCFGCAPYHPTAYERQAIAWWFGRLVIWGVIASWIGGDWGWGFVAIAWMTMALTDPLNTALHEAGHAIAVRAVGFRLLSVQIGRGPEILALRRGAARIGLRRYAILGGHTLYFPPDAASRWREGLVFLGGPLVNLVAACAFGVGGLALYDHAGAWAQVGTAIAVGLVISHLRTLADTLWPRALAEGGVTDGARLLALFRCPEPARRDDPRLSQLILAERLKATGRHAEVADLLAEMLCTWPNDPYLLGMVIHHTSRAAGDRAALARYQALVATAPSGPPHPFDMHGKMVGWLAANIAWSTIKAEADLEAADRELQTALECLPEAPEVKATLGALYVARGESEAGERLLINAMRIVDDPQDRADFCFYIARARRGRGEAGGAAEADRLRDHILAMAPA